MDREHILEEVSFTCCLECGLDWPHVESGEAKYLPGITGEGLEHSKCEHSLDLRTCRALEASDVPAK